MKKSRIILSGVSVLLVLSLLIGGTMAWFTDTEKVNANFSAGVLDISVEPGVEDQTTLEFKNLRPMKYENFENELNPAGGDNEVGENGMNVNDFDPHPVYFQPVKITNGGTLPTKVDISVNLGKICKDGEANTQLSKDGETINWDKKNNLTCTNGLKKVLKIFIYKNTGTSWERIEDVNLNKSYDDAVANPDKEVGDNTGPETKTVYTTAMLPAGDDVTYVIAGYLPETVGNAYQGKHYHADLMFNAYQMDEGASGGAPDEEPDPELYQVTVHYNDMAGEQTFDPVQHKLGSEKKEYSVSTADLTAPAGYEFVANQAAQSVAVDENGTVTPDSITFNVQKIAPAGPDGSEENPYLIMNSTDFNNIPKLDGEDVYFVLGANINLGSYIPLADFKGHLNGEYEGVKYTIQYVINGTDQLGLFVNNSGELKNLTILEGSVINSSGNRAGSFAVNNSGSIVDCVSHVAIKSMLDTSKAENSEKNSYFGGIVCENVASGKITGTEYRGTINGNLDDMDAGMAAYTEMLRYNAGLASINYGEIADCKIVAPEGGYSVKATWYSGGVASENRGAISGITMDGDVFYGPTAAEFQNSRTVAIGNPII